MFDRDRIGLFALMFSLMSTNNFVIAVRFLHHGASEDRLEALRIFASPIPTAESENNPFADLVNCSRLNFLGLPAPLPAVIRSDSVTSLGLYRPSHADIEVLPTHFPSLTTLYVTDPQQVTGSPIHFPNLLGLYVRSFQPTQGILDHISAPNLTITYVTVRRW